MAAVKAPVLIEPGQRVFLAAAMGESSECIKLIKSDKDIANWQDGDGWSPLVVAIYSGHEEAAVSLIDAGADISITTKDKWSPVFVSAFYGRMSVLKCLVKKRVDVNVKTRGGWTPLMVAVTKNEIEVAEILLAAGARDEINHVAKCDGDSALSLAAKGRFEGMCRLLISSGAKIVLAIKDKAGRTSNEVKAFLEGLKLSSGP